VYAFHPNLLELSNTQSEKESTPCKKVMNISKMINGFLYPPTAQKIRREKIFK
jgi:hypothetical protein